MRFTSQYYQFTKVKSSEKRIKVKKVSQFGRSSRVCLKGRVEIHWFQHYNGNRNYIEEMEAEYDEGKDRKLAGEPHEG